MTLSSADRAYIRSQAEEALPVTVDILRAQREPDGQGGMTETLAIVYQDIPARLAQLAGTQAGRELLRAGRVVSEDAWWLTTPYDIAIEAQDVVQYAGIRYQVTFVNDGQSYETARRCLLMRVS